MLVLLMRYFIKLVLERLCSGEKEPVKYHESLTELPKS